MRIIRVAWPRVAIALIAATLFGCSSESAISQEPGVASSRHISNGRASQVAWILTESVTADGSWCLSLLGDGVKVADGCDPPVDGPPINVMVYNGQEMKGIFGVASGRVASLSGKTTKGHRYSMKRVKSSLSGNDVIFWIGAASDSPRTLLAYDRDGRQVADTSDKIAPQ